MKYDNGYAVDSVQGPVSVRNNRVIADGAG